MELIYEVDIRSRETGNSIETIYSGTHEEAWDVFYEWYKKHPSIKKELDEIGGAVDYLIDGTKGVFVDVYVCYPEQVHGVGKFNKIVERENGIGVN